MILRVARFAELDASTLYALLRLRVDVFVVEQRSAYPELDGRDDEPGTRHLWLDHDGPRAYLRLLTEPDGSVRIGRVAVAPDSRGAGLAGRLMSAALDLVPAGVRCVLHAQSHLSGFYAGFGFVTTGPEYVEDGITHLPMSRP